MMPAGMPIDQRDHEGGGAELDRGAEELTKLTGDGLVGADGVAKIEREGGLEEVGVLDGQGAVETELLADARHLLDAALVAGHGGGGVTGNQLDHDEHGGHDPEEHRDGEEQAAGDVSGHRRAIEHRLMHRSLDRRLAPHPPCPSRYSVTVGA